MNKTFTRISPEHPLIQRLDGNSWWGKVRAFLEKERDVNVQMRDNYFNIYYKMNSIGKVFLNKGKIAYLIHNEFLKDDMGPKKGYAELTVQDTFLALFPKNNRYQYAIDLFSESNSKLLKRKVSRHARPGKEKIYQGKLILMNKETIVDAEIAFNEQLQEVNGEGERAEKRRTRIDLLNFDRHQNMLVAIELKMIGNPELYSGSIRGQLKKYTDFLISNETYIQRACKNAINAKVRLGLLRSGCLLEKITPHVNVAKKPLLVVVCRNQKAIEARRDQIIKAVQDIALGVYFFGEGGDLNISSKRHKNKVLF